MKKRVSLRDVAKHCGVSPMTVSYVVRNINCVKASTRQKVQAAIRELGYEIDPMLRALAAYRSKSSNPTKYKSTLAFFDSEPSRFSHSIYEHCRREAREIGYDLTYFKQPQTHEEQAKFSKRLWAQGIRGILFGPCQQEFDLEGFEFERFAMVGIGAFQHHPAVDTVCLDYFQGLYLAAQRSMEHGYRNIALFLLARLEARTGHRWLGAYKAFCEHWNRKPLVWIFDTVPADKEVLDWVRKNRIDAVLTLSKTVPKHPRLARLRQVLLNDWDVSPGEWHLSGSQELIAKESIQLLDNYLLHRKYGIPEHPKQISIQATFHTE